MIQLMDIIFLNYLLIVTYVFFYVAYWCCFIIIIVNSVFQTLAPVEINQFILCPHGMCVTSVMYKFMS